MTGKLEPLKSSRILMENKNDWKKVITLAAINLQNDSIKKFNSLKL